MLFILHITQIVISVFLIAGVLLQQRGGGLSPVFGGEGGMYRTRRGIEKFIFQATVVLGALFLLSAIANIVIQSRNPAPLPNINIPSLTTTTATPDTTTAPTPSPEALPKNPLLLP